MSSFHCTGGGLAELEWNAQEGGGLNADQWFPSKKVSHNIFLKQRKLKLRRLCCFQLQWSIIGKIRLIAAADQLQEVIDAMDTAGRECIHQT